MLQVHSELAKNTSFKILLNDQNIRYYQWIPVIINVFDLILLRNARNSAYHFNIIFQASPQVHFSFLRIPFLQSACNNWTYGNHWIIKVKINDRFFRVVLTQMWH